MAAMARGAAPVKYGHDPQRAFIGIIGNQQVANAMKAERTAGQVRSPMAHVGKGDKQM
jgi:hypothetical protein